MSKVIAMTLVCVKDPGRLYRPMHCASCESVRLHAVDFIGAERSEKGVWVWFKTRCSGIHAPDGGRSKIHRLQKPCFKEQRTSLPFIQWQSLKEDRYY